MFKSINVGGSGTVSIDEFKAMFVKKYTCVNAISVTDNFDISNSKTLCKLEAGEILDGLGEKKAAEEGSMPRLKCRVTSSGLNGWVTMQGNGGTKFVSTVS